MQEPNRRCHDDTCQEAADRAVKKVFAILGVDVDNLTNEVALQGAFRNLTGSASGLDADVDYAVDEIVLGDGSGNYAVARNVTKTITMSTSGAGGLDTGAVAASTWYYGYVIVKDDGTVAALASLSASSPTLPAGYTKWARVGSFRTDATANKYPLAFAQADRSVQYKVASGSNVTGLPKMASGSAGSVTVPTYVAVSVANFIPPTAKVIKLLVYVSSVSDRVSVVPNASYGPQLSTTNPPMHQLFPNGTAGMYSYPTAMILESASIYWASLGAGCGLHCVGWEDSF